MNYLAFDLGAKSGRAVLGKVTNGRIFLRELHRFPNKTIFQKGHLRWDVDALFSEIKATLKLVAKKKIVLAGIGVDTWGVDFSLLDKNGKLLENPVTYRDSRTDGVMEKVFSALPKKTIYQKTGIQFLPINTLYQLYELKKSNPEILKKAQSLLFIPDLFNYLLTRKKVSESTIASTSQLLGAKNKQWVSEIFTKLGLPKNIMPKLVKAGSIIGKTTLAELKGVRVFAAGSHDTASAVAAMPTVNNKPQAFLSSGTWSLMGVEIPRPIINAKGLKMNFTNEAGVYGTFRLLKNITGFWLLQECHRNWLKAGKKISYKEIISSAKKAKPFTSLINVNYSGFLHPQNMPKAIADFCRLTNQSVPKSVGEFARCILESMALEYRFTLLELEELLGKKINVLQVVGGGSQNALLNQLTANATSKLVLCGPVEATALGNILVQAIANKEFKTLKQARLAVKKSFSQKVFKPQNLGPLWKQAFLRYNALKVRI